MTNRNIPILRRLGPGLITASVVLGPGSIVAASRAGAQGGYRLIWLLVTAGVLMAVYTSMGARLGCALDMTPLAYVAKRAGRWLAVLGGISAFLVAAGFQFVNNMGVALAASGLTGTPGWVWPIVFTSLSLLFLFWAKHVYVFIERLMIALVGIMILCFFTNLFWTGINLPKLFGGLIPRMAEGDALIARAMFPTTFSAVAAFYQAYLVQAKAWRRDQLPDAVRDAWAGIAILGLISAAILTGAAQTLHATGGSFGNLGELAKLLRESLGPAANLVFCCGLGAAAFSSFIVNAVIGGALLADGLGLNADINGRPTKVLASVAMLVGCGVALATFGLGAGTTTSLLIAQASTLVAAPLCAVLLLVMTSNRAIMGDLRNRLPTIILGCAGLAVVFWLCAMWLLDKIG